MFRFFPTNYVWDLSINLSIEMGAKMGEIQEMCGPLAEAAQAKDAEGTAAFRQTWVTMADKLISLGEEDLALGRNISAGEKFVRAGKLHADRRAVAGARRAGADFRRETLYRAKISYGGKIRFKPDQK